MFFKKKQKKFQEPGNTAVFTTKYVIRDKKPITYVTHDEEDGAWQFFSSDEFENFEEVAMVVALAEIVAIDPSLWNWLICLLDIMESGKRPIINGVYDNN
jgi:hypothetical protein